jgi:glycosyltransferase involved in cell wall biosynthesis
VSDAKPNSLTEQEVVLGMLDPSATSKLSFMGGVAPLVSIGLPVYNSEKFIGRAIDSALSQTLEAHELVISDNASTDHTEEICRGFASKDGRIRYFRNTENVGIALNFAKTVHASRGIYFKWLASDDFMSPLFLERCVKLFDAQPSLSIATGRMLFADENSEILKADLLGSNRTAYGEKLIWVEPPPELFSDRPSVRYSGALSSARFNLFAALYYGLVPGDLMRSVRPVGFHIGAEKTFLLQLLLRGRVGFIEEDLHFRGMHPDHFGASNRPKMLRGLNPNEQRKIALSAFDQLAAYVRVIQEAPISNSEKTRCLVHVVSRALSLPIFRNVFRRGPNNYLGLTGRPASLPPDSS